MAKREGTRQDKRQEASAPGVHKQRLLHAVWQLNKTLVRTVDELLAPLDLNAASFGTLNLLLPGQMSSADLARAQGLTPQTVNVAVNALVAQGFVERGPHPVHGRIKVLSVTKRGQQSHAKASKLMESVEEAMRDAVGARMFSATQDTLLRLLDAVGGPTGTSGPLWPFGGPQRS